MLNQYPVHKILFILLGCAFIENDDDDIDSVATTTFTPNEHELPSSAVEAALTPSFTRKSQLSGAEARCLDM